MLGVGEFCFSNYFIASETILFVGKIVAISKSQHFKKLFTTGDMCVLCISSPPLYNLPIYLYFLVCECEIPPLL